MKEIQLEDAKAILSALIDRAKSGEPAVIIRDGRMEAVRLSFAHYQLLSNKPSFGKLLASFPAEAEDIPPRNRRPARDVDL